MRNILSRRRKGLFGFFAIVFAVSLIFSVGGGFFQTTEAQAKVTLQKGVWEEGSVPFNKANPQVKAVLDVQERNTALLMEEPGVIGTAIGLSSEGRPVIFVLAESFESAKEAIIPSRIEGVPVIVKLTGKIEALKGRPVKPDTTKVDPTARFDRPVPIGVSTGHPDITAGTIGCRVTDGTNVYALSNNHVYANENNAQKDDPVLQPGAYDGGTLADTIGTLDQFVPISFSNDNEIDAAIALSSPDDLGNATPSDGYGMPKSQPIDAAIGQSVMKYGRTTSQTKGRIWAINATVNVQYDSGVARFVNQIIITPGSFSAGGDSGSLIVIQKGGDARKPVGLLFAGSSSYTIANPIGAVLENLGVTIDGEE